MFFYLNQGHVQSMIFVEYLWNKQRVQKTFIDLDRQLPIIVV